MSASLQEAAAPILAAAMTLRRGSTPALLAIDGRCGSGKSTLGRWLADQLGCELIHMDDFYLPFADRRPDWTRCPGANMDFARLRRELLDPLLAGHPAPYRAYLCRHGRLAPARMLPPSPLTIVEGSYVLHPDLGVPFACKVFVTCAPDCQRRRLQQREGDNFGSFLERWIPLEEGYLAEYHPEQHCNFVLDTTVMSV